MDTLPFLVLSPEESEEGTKALFSPSFEVGEFQIPVLKLKENMNQVCKGVIDVFNDIKSIGDFKLKEIEIAVEVNAEGGVTLVGTAKIGGKGAIKLVFSE